MQMKMRECKWDGGIQPLSSSSMSIECVRLLAGCRPSIVNDQ